MPKSRHRKKHKEKVAARNREMKNKLAYIQNLTKQLSTAISEAKNQPIVQTISTSRLELPGQNNQNNYDKI
jgi:hypothetical protein